MKVSILVFSGVEELDFAGFLEVLAVANRVRGRKYFETELVGTEAGPIECSGGLKIIPDVQLRDLKGQDVLFVPGGGARRRTGIDALMENKLVRNALKQTYDDGKMVWSVCTGALLLAQAGLLNGRMATTNHAFLDDLKQSGAKVQKARVVVDGRITTGGGISSSIDVGIELVRETLGQKTAEEVGKRMEYPPPKS